MPAVKTKFYIGDVHGRADLLEKMLEGIELHSQDNNRNPEVVFLGDLIDRGPNSREVLNLVNSSVDKWHGSSLILGNHDEWFLETVRQGMEYPDANNWLHHGGIQTIMSYCDGELPNNALDIIMTKYPAHIELLSNAARIQENGQFIAVHAGIDPTLSLDQQPDLVLNWIREPFLTYVDPKIRPVIHGHTIMSARPIVTENRISIDTGAYQSDLLTACLVDAENKTISFFQASRHNFEEVTPVLLNRGYGTLYDRLDEIFATEPETV